MPTATGSGDYNSDREGHVKHEYVVINADEKPKTSIKVEGKEFNFNKDGYFKIPGDPGLAQTIRQQVGKSATVKRVRADSAADRGHKYHFGQLPEMPWKRKKTDEKESQDHSEETANEEEEGQETLSESERRTV